jgi:hypothetical protein
MQKSKACPAKAPPLYPQIKLGAGGERIDCGAKMVLPSIVLFCLF